VSEPRRATEHDPASPRADTIYGFAIAGVLTALAVAWGGDSWLAVVVVAGGGSLLAAINVALVRAGKGLLDYHPMPMQRTTLIGSVLLLAVWLVFALVGWGSPGSGLVWQAGILAALTLARTFTIGALGPAPPRASSSS
jgi:hypothetical protein